MVIRIGNDGSPPLRSAGGGLPASMTSDLSDAGLLKPGGNPREAAQPVLAVLRQGGFEGGAGDTAAQLSAALRAFQQGNGLPPNGRLDAATAQALAKAGLLPGSEQLKEEKAQKDGFERAQPSLLKAGERARADAVKHQSPDTNFLDALLNKLGGDVGSTSDTHAGNTGTAGEAAVGKGLAAKEGREAKDNRSDVDAKKGARDARESGQASDKGDAARVHVARGLKAEQARAEEKKRRDALSGRSPSEPGILDEEADEDAVDGDGGQGRKRGHGGDQEGGHDEDGSDIAGGAGDDAGDDHTGGNAHSGTHDPDVVRRGHATLDDGSEADPGHYRVPSLSEQAFAALEALEMDATEENRATTYSWDIRFYRPGVYSAGQQALELVHLAVQKATAFDPAWQKAQANVAAMVKRLEGEARAPSLDDIIQALRQARARNGDTAAATLSISRPPGRA